MTPIPVYIPFGKTSDILVAQYVGDGLVAAKVQTHAGLTAGPLRLLAIKPAPGCEALYDQAVRAVVVEGTVLHIAPSGQTLWSGQVQVVEPVLPDGTWLSDRLLREGIAVPDLELEGVNLKVTSIGEALKFARSHRVGYWHNLGAETQASTLLGSYAQRSTPTSSPFDAFSSLAIGTVILILLAAGFRDSKHKDAKLNRWQKLRNLFMCGSRGSFK